MKRHGYLYEKVMTYENVCEAWRNILKNLDRLLSRRFAKADYLALMSRKGWLMAAAKTHTPAIITHGGAIW